MLRLSSLRQPPTPGVLHDKLMPVQPLQIFAFSALKFGFPSAVRLAVVEEEQAARDRAARSNAMAGSVSTGLEPRLMQDREQPHGYSYGLFALPGHGQ